MDTAGIYQTLRWRKRLERKGWLNARRFPPPQHELIEYHAAWRGRIYSGRCRLADCDPMTTYWQPGSHVYFLSRGLELDVSEAVWRRVKQR